MKFDQARNSAELRDLFDYLACIAVGCAAAEIVGMSWVTTSVVVLFGFRHWKQKGRKLSPRLRVLAILTCFTLILAGNWPSYRAGVSAGYEAAATRGQGEADKPAEATRLHSSPVRT